MIRNWIWDWLNARVLCLGSEYIIYIVCSAYRVLVHVFQLTYWCDTYIKYTFDICRVTENRLVRVALLMIYERTAGPRESRQMDFLLFLRVTVCMRHSPYPQYNDTPVLGALQPLFIAKRSQCDWRLRHVTKNSLLKNGKFLVSLIQWKITSFCSQC